LLSCFVILTSAAWPPTCTNNNVTSFKLPGQYNYTTTSPTTQIRMWGAAGGSLKRSLQTLGAPALSPGGFGAYVVVSITASVGTNLSLIVGSGGGGSVLPTQSAGLSGGTFGNGGSGGSGNASIEIQNRIQFG